LDHGEKSYDKDESREKFLAVHDFRARLKALKDFNDENSAERWAWLTSRGVVLLYNGVTSPNGEKIQLRFDKADVFFNNIDSGWPVSDVFRALYGLNLERIHEKIISIFGKIPEETGLEAQFGYFGYFTLQSVGKGRELPNPKAPTNEWAVKTVWRAATDALKLPPLVFMPPDTPAAAQTLNHLGFQVLTLEQFLADY
jgi:hypothetical protein